MKEFNKQHSKEETLQKRGYTVVTMWDCQFRKLQKNSDICRTFFDKYPVLWNEPLEPRDSFLEHQCDEALSPLQRSGAH
jgi:hypothetical protein